MNCPKCKTELGAGDVQGVPVSRCASCHGNWIDEEGFNRAKDLADPHVGWMDFDLWKEHERYAVEGRELACPTCTKPMFAMSYAGTSVAIDYCHDCRGIWLDETDFEDIVASLEAEVSQMPAGELMDAALREAGEIVKSPRSLVEWKHAASVLQLLKLRLLVDHPNLRRLLVEFEKGTPFG